MARDFGYRVAFHQMKTDNPVGAYIMEHKRLMQTKVASSHASAARLMTTYHPDLVAEVMDRIGMHPSSEAELRALQNAYSGSRNRSGKTKPRDYGTDRDRFHGNPNARRNRAGAGTRASMRNEYGMTYLEWLYAAGYDLSSARGNAHALESAWRNGEDPSEYRASRNRSGYGGNMATKKRAKKTAKKTAKRPAKKTSKRRATKKAGR